jgi:N,N-dimethylformamidase
VSSALSGRYRADIVRLRCADHSGIGMKQSTIESAVNGEYPGRFQPVYAGSFVEVPAATAFHRSQVTLQAYVWPTTPHKGPQAFIGRQSCFRWYSPQLGGRSQ